MSSGYLQTRPEPALLSLVVPCYNEEESLPLLAAEITRFINASPYPCEVILVNDGSTDRTIEFLVDWSTRDRRIKVLSFSRNFGHQLAATAGVDYATGDAVVLIDADLQDPLDVIHDMVAQYRNGYDVVCGQRSVRAGENFFKRATAWFFYRLMQTFFLKSLPADVGDFRLMSRRCVSSLSSMRELHRFLRGMVAWVGYPQICVRYERRPRVAGTTKYPLSRMIRLAWNAAVSFSPLPLRMSFFAGGLMALLAVEEAVRALVALSCRTHRSRLDLAHDCALHEQRSLAHHGRHSGRVRRQDLRGEQRPPALHCRRRVERRAQIRNTTARSALRIRAPSCRA